VNESGPGGRRCVQRVVGWMLLRFLDTWVVSVLSLSSSAQLIINELYHAFISAPVLYTSNGSKAKHNNLLSETLHQLTSTSFSFAFEETLLFLSDMCLRRVLCIILNSDEIYLGGPFCATFILQIDLEGSQAM
jgi:hypothetical protein